MPRLEPTLDWTTARWAEGRELAHLVLERVERDRLVAVLGQPDAGAVRKWEQGRRVGYFTADRVLVAIGMLPSTAPPRLWSQSTARATRPDS